LFGTAKPQATERLHSTLRSQPEGHTEYQILLISKSESGLHIACNFGGQAPFRRSFLDSNGREKNSLSHTWTGAYNGLRAKYDKPQVPGWNPRPSKISRRRNFNKNSHLRRIASGYSVEAAGIAPASRITQIVSQHDVCVEHGCRWLQYVCTEAALQELLANWHRLTPPVRTAIMALLRDGRVAGQ